MNYDEIMIHYGELSTKGDNRPLFVKELMKNVKHSLEGYPDVRFRYNHDHAYVLLNGTDPEEILPILQEVSGIQRLSPVMRCEKDKESIEKTALENIRSEKGKTFKVKAKRSDKNYPIPSPEIASSLGGYILDNTDLEVDLHSPDITLNVDIRKEGAYIYCHSYKGAGGYPLGMNGKVLHLLSGGIDSPVAAYMLLRRGIKVEMIHFAAPPYTSEAVIDKLTDIMNILGNYQEDIRLNIIPFTKLQLAIYKNVPEPYCITIMRRMMLRIAERVAHRRNCLAISTGESIGQVASQTLESINTINSVTNYPILRPLATMDKLDVIEQSEKIGTYDISIRPYEDCCTIFKPKKPKTKPKIDECLLYESSFDYESLIDECIKEMKNIHVKNHEIID